MAAAQTAHVQRALTAWLPALLLGVLAVLSAAVLGSGGSLTMALARLAVGSCLSLASAINRSFARPDAWQGEGLADGI
jgi:hypothetical protein